MAIDLTLEGLQVLTPEGWADQLHLTEGLICAVPQAKRVRLPGWLAMPGIVDMHGDGFERHVAPRRGALRDMASGLQSVEAELAANGITTAVLAQFWSWEGGMRGPEAARRLCSGLAAHETLGTDIRIQLRLESHVLDEFDSAEALIETFGISYVVFNDHLPHAKLADGKRPPRLTGQALKAGVNPEKYLARMIALHAWSSDVPGAVQAMAERLAAKGVRLGSHDDPDAQTRRAMQARGLTIAEFPETVEAASAPSEGVILGAPNVMRGASHAGKVSAREVIAEGLCDALASDYHYPSPRFAAMALAREIGWDAAWGMVSSGPARLLGLEDRGALTPGARADVVLLDPKTGRVGATIADGKVTHMVAEVAEALLRA
ncbi:alpha-D-ribose 1-methylphosphonate 5-triphosphate diphosphatase [Pseudaestuariivita sp.]|uniref:alpha-D-ribose 1-methylphosphonate 5-triphosphate diphosphatase n=1 Tax=Pseudaestuariivita sp. TaxID=2211669 RepID=UPI004059C713